MSGSKTDRRVKYTKMVLKDALVEMMQKQHISQISIKSLCELADINRSTFYAHFTDQFDLLRQVEQEVLANLKLFLEAQDYEDNQPVSQQVLIKILDYVKDDSALFKALLSKNCDVAIQKDIVSLTQVVSVKYDNHVDARTIEYIVEFGINGCVSILNKWLKDDMPESTESMAELLLQILYYGMSKFQ